ncbi:MAG: AAA family ATPase [Spirochaetia bacterium]|jgi:predicted AAA+ superfamily ATPase|nr:AAA family ATPase [Spirochaetia bacterium]
MKRNIEKQLLEWAHKKDRKPLLLNGARQVGKTYILKEFGKSYFSNVHYFDLEEQKNVLTSIFTEGSLDPKTIIDKLSFISGKVINIDDDLLILDEIQSIPRAITSLKYFRQEMAGLAVAAAGSNLGISHAEAAFPVGKIESLFLYPMNFEEFLLGTNETHAFNFLDSFQGDKTDDIYHARLFELLKIYFITGGLPEVIVEYLKERDNPLVAFKNVRRLQKLLLLHYGNDFGKYAGHTNSRHIERVFNSVPSQLSKVQDSTSKKYRFKDVISNGYRTYEDLADPINWLVRAGLVLRIDISEYPTIPIFGNTLENSFKLFLFDIGLLGAMVKIPPETIMQYKYGTYKGYFAENFVLQEMISYGFTDVVTWMGRTSEIEFVFQLGDKLVPVEVKAGTNTKAKSLQAYISKYHPEMSFKITGNKFGIDRQKKIYNYPLYLMAKFPPDELRNI